MTSGAWGVASWRRTLGGEINVHPPWKRIAAAPRRVPCGRAVRTGPSTPGLRPSGRDDGGGRLQNRRVGCAARGMGFATEDTEGTEAIRVSQVYSVVSVILCGLSCPCVLFILSVGVRLALGGMATQSVAMGRRAAPVHRQDMPTRAWACHPAPRRSDTIAVIPSDAVRSRAKHRGSRNPFFSVAQRHRSCSCVMASGTSWKRCLNGSLHCGPSALRSG